MNRELNGWVVGFERTKFNIVAVDDDDDDDDDDEDE